MNNIETMKQWLEALELSHPRFGVGTAIHIKAVATLRQAIEQAESVTKEAEKTHRFIRQLDQAIEQAQQAEPDYYGFTKDHLWMSITKDHYDRLKPEFRMACYTSPPPRQPLTDEEIKQIWLNGKDHGDDWLDVQSIARAIEAAHGIKA